MFYVTGGGKPISKTIVVKIVNFLGESQSKSSLFKNLNWKGTIRLRNYLERISQKKVGPMPVQTCTGSGLLSDFPKEKWFFQLFSDLVWPCVYPKPEQLLILTHHRTQ